MKPHGVYIRVMLVPIPDAAAARHGVRATAMPILLLKTSVPHRLSVHLAVDVPMTVTVTSPMPVTPVPPTLVEELGSLSTRGPRR